MNFVDISLNMKDKKMFATRIDKETLKNLKFLGVHLEKSLSSLFEEAIQDLLKKYEKKPIKPKNK
jgi:hypothetical protein